VTVELKGTLAREAGRARLEVAAPGPRPVEAVLEELAEAQPVLEGLLFDRERGGVAYTVMVALNGEVVHWSRLTTRAVEAGDRLELFPVLAGG